MVRELSDRDMAEMALAENVKRGQLSAIEKATAAERLINEFGLTQVEVGQLLGLKSPASVSHLLSLLQLPVQIRDLVHARQLPERHAREIVRVVEKRNERAALRVAECLMQTPASERDLELPRLVQNALGGAHSFSHPVVENNPEPEQEPERPIFPEGVKMDISSRRVVSFVDGLAKLLASSRLSSEIRRTPEGRQLYRLVAGALAQWRKDSQRRQMGRRLSGSRRWNKRSRKDRR
jgi:ParB-like chromosome segregation protein Spo0J